jgi:hypothetical protein
MVLCVPLWPDGVVEELEVLQLHLGPTQAQQLRLHTAVTRQRDQNQRNEVLWGSIAARLSDKCT